MPHLEPCNLLKVCRHGQMLFNRHDAYIGRSLDLYGEYSEGEVDLFRQVVTPGAVVVEAGANIGAHTVFLARQAGCVVAFEPQRILFQILCANVALNSLLNVQCLQQALGARPGALIVPGVDYARDNNFGGVSLADGGPGERVGVATLDGLDLPRCDFVKIDVEGMEQQVLEGAARTLTAFRPVLYVENDRPARSTALVRHLNSLGYAMYWHRPPYFNPNNFFANPDNVFGRLVSLNMLCVPAEQTPHLEGFEPVAVPPAAP